MNPKVSSDKVSSLSTFPSTDSDISSKNQRALIMKGGGIKGLAYVGAVDVLLRQYDFNWFIGTSAGAIAAILLGAGYSPKELREILQDKNFKDFFDAKWYQQPSNLIFHKGLHPAETFTFWLDELLAKKLNSHTRVKMSELPNRVTVYASRRGMSVLKFDSKDSDADAAYAARCSMSIPWVFIPQSHQGFRSYDGGIQNNYPVDQLLEEYPGTPFISLFLGSEVYEPVKPKSVLSDLISIVTESSEPETVKKYRKDTVIIDPRPIGTLDFSLSSDEKEFLLLAGRAAALSHLDSGSEEYIKTKQKRDEVKNRVEATRKFKNNKRFWKRVLVLALFLSIIAFGVVKLSEMLKSETTKTEGANTTKTEGANANINQLNSNIPQINKSSSPTPTSSEPDLKKIMKSLTDILQLEGGQDPLVNQLELLCSEGIGYPGDFNIGEARKILYQVRRIKSDIIRAAQNGLVLDKYNPTTYRQLILDFEKREYLLGLLISKKSSDKNLNPKDLCNIADEYRPLKDRVYELASDYYRNVLKVQQPPFQ